MNNKNITIVMVYLVLALPPNVVCDTVDNSGNYAIMHQLGLVANHETLNVDQLREIQMNEDYGRNV